MLDRVRNYDIFCFLKRHYSPIIEKGDHYSNQQSPSHKKERPENDSSQLEGHSLCTTYPFELFGMAICYDNGCPEGELAGWMELF